jgi:hypothetical protein
MCLPERIACHSAKVGSFLVIVYDFSVVGKHTAHAFLKGICLAGKKSEEGEAGRQTGKL